MSENMISSQTGYIHVICPACGHNTIEIKGGACLCGKPLPFAFIVSYAAQWGFTPELEEIFSQNTALRLMGKYAGKTPERLSLLTHAEYLYLSRYPEFSFTMLAEFSQLQILELDYMSLKNLSGIEHLNSLQSLSLIECRAIDNIEALSENPNLRVLDIALCNRLTRLEPVRACRDLLHLRYDGHILEDVDALSGLRQLKCLILNTKVLSKDLGPICGLPLEKLVIKKNSFPKEQISDFVAKHPECNVRVN
ncbi:MAG: hypothetical protein ACO1QS_04865 [Verrucomicrobiota bacterium]